MFTGTTTNLSENIYTPMEVVINSDEYLMENITIGGYYFNRFDLENYSYISSVKIERPIEQGELNNKIFLLANFSNTKKELSENIKYEFTGKLKSFNTTDFPLDKIILWVYNVTAE